MCPLRKGSVGPTGRIYLSSGQLVRLIYGLYGIFFFHSLGTGCIVLFKFYSMYLYRPQSQMEDEMYPTLAATQRFCTSGAVYRINWYYIISPLLNVGNLFFLVKVWIWILNPIIPQWWKGIDQQQQWHALYQTIPMISTFLNITEDYTFHTRRGYWNKSADWALN